MQVVEHHHTDAAAETTEGLLVQLSRCDQPSWPRAITCCSLEGCTM